MKMHKNIYIEKNTHKIISLGASQKSKIFEAAGKGKNQNIDIKIDVFAAIN